MAQERCERCDRKAYDLNEQNLCSDCEEILHLRQAVTDLTRQLADAKAEIAALKDELQKANDRRKFDAAKIAALKAERDALQDKLAAAAIAKVEGDK